MESSQFRVREDKQNWKHKILRQNLGCYGLGFYVLMSGIIDLDGMKASEANYKALGKFLNGSLIYLVGPLELYTWKRVKFLQLLLKSENAKIPLETIKDDVEQQEPKQNSANFILSHKTTTTTTRR